MFRPSLVRHVGRQLLAQQLRLASTFAHGQAAAPDSSKCALTVAESDQNRFWGRGLAAFGVAAVGAAAASTISILVSANSLEPLAEELLETFGNAATR